MQSLILGYDAEDHQAPQRRLAAREAHLALGARLRDAGNFLYGVAMLSDRGAMCSSMLVADFESREALDRWLQQEPYVTGQVWKKIEVIPRMVGPSFVDLKLG
jgi:uncharacterized protein